MEFYLAIKGNEILLFIGKWMTLENIILSEIRQIQKEKVHMLSFIYGSWFQDKYKSYLIYM
jgi:hypothetical protein